MIQPKNSQTSWIPFLGLNFLIFVWVAVFYSPSSLASPKAYKKTLKHWTRHQELYQRPDFYASLNWTATLLSPDFLMAQKHYLKTLYNFDQSEQQQYDQQQKQRFGQQTAFFLSFYTYNYKESDLSQKRSVWQLRLAVNGEKVYKPTIIKKVTKPNALLKRLFPYIQPWAQHFYVFFPDIENVRHKTLELRVHGPDGQAKLEWPLHP